MPDNAGTPKNQSTLKDSDLFDNNLLTNDLNRIIAKLNKKNVSAFDFVSAVGLIVLIIYLILEF